ncbi:hypothetical protein CF15_05440 [Pyrodictium occultum]|uniref:CdvA-like coiled-coil domain-containing protein n=1 Tax=Pyrodictium occultum TaxID=2309 RepID=A0A0V8RVZ4_PYROC|nr:CdvA-like protein [Pyrodictium occultum]KSW12205.1 hypothetical protein CF15_05440 [Pyrodictium occultum]
MARPPLTVDKVQEFIGETVYDPYGRVAGRLVSFESDVDGLVQNVVVETEDRDVRFIPAEAVEIKDGRIIVWPEWKTIAYKVTASYQRALKRLKGLEDIYSRNEIPSVVYHEMRKRLNDSLSKLKEEAKKLREIINRRMHEIEDNNLKLDRAIANLKVSYMAGEIGEKAYKTAIERLRGAKDSNTRELEDLKNTKGRIEALENGAIELAKTKSEAKAEKEKNTAPATVQGLQPIPVKVIEG